METELKYLLKGKWKYNIHENRLICKNTQGNIIILENKDNLFFQKALTILHQKGTPDPELIIKYNQPTVQIPLELLHRVMRSNEIMYTQEVILDQTWNGLTCYSEHTNRFHLNHHEYNNNQSVTVDPQKFCKITRRIRDRERVLARIRLNPTEVILECEFPWMVITIILPTIQNRSE